jgi:hypothetical protein
MTRETGIKACFMGELLLKEQGVPSGSMRKHASLDACGATANSKDFWDFPSCGRRKRMKEKG